MENKYSALMPIALDFLAEGMVLQEDIYNYNGTILLLAKGNTISGNQIEQLRKRNSYSRNISVFGNTHKALLAHGLEQSHSLSEKRLEDAVGNMKAAKTTECLFAQVKEHGNISHKEVTKITDGMMGKLQRISPSLIFEAINLPKPIDEYLQWHCVNVGFLNGLMGQWMGLSEEKIEKLVVIGLVHDIGKTKIPQTILNAPRQLTLAEYEVVKMHPIYTYELLDTDDRFAEDIKQAALQHHEKMNGTGYPSGLQVADISLYGRITAISDIYDAMVSARAYKKASSPFTILAQLVKNQFSDLDMQLVNLFTEHMPNELIGKSTLLSDGSMGTIRYILPGSYEYPIVEINGELKITNEQFFCTQILIDGDRNAG